VKGTAFARLGAAPENVKTGDALRLEP